MLCCVWYITIFRSKADRKRSHEGFQYQTISRFSLFDYRLNWINLRIKPRPITYLISYLRNNFSMQKVERLSLYMPEKFKKFCINDSVFLRYCRSECSLRLITSTFPFRNSDCFSIENLLCLIISINYRKFNWV